MNTKQMTGEIVTSYLEKFPTLPSNTIAKMIYDEHPQLFKDKDTVRSSVRSYRGRIGNKSRKQLTDRRFVLPEPTKENPYSFPESSEGEYVDYHIPSSLKRGLIFGDIHIPYQDNKVLTTIFKRGKKRKPDFIILNGDIMDHYKASPFKQDPTKDDLIDEIKSTRQFLATLRDNFPDALIVFKYGNHDDRWKYYLWTHAPQLVGFDEFRLSVILGLYELGIESVEDKRVIRCGKLTVIHAHEFWQSIINPVNPARGLYLKGKATAICNHFHQSSEHTEPDLQFNMISCWSVGCCCQLHPEFMPINRWNHGFAEIDKTPDGNFKLDNIRMINGEIV